jgi:tetratricopeptide (TPR) repeat protein
VGRYRIVEHLGTGGGGSVYRAHDPQLSRDIALKVLHRRHGLHVDDDEYSRRLLREAKTLAKLSHPNVVAAYDVGSFEGSLFVAMELVQGESLREWLLREKPDRQRVLRVLIAIGRGLIAAHAAGVMHRDIKPANVMVSPEGGVRIVDFGLARALRSNTEVANPRVEHASDPIAFSVSPSNEATETAQLSGTPGYIAPEILRGESVIDAQVDQYSYAVTAFQALTGQKPYPGNTLQEYWDALMRDERTPWPRSIPRRIRRVIERGLASRHEERYPNMRALVEALEKASEPNRIPAAVAALGLGTALIVATTLTVKERSQWAACRVDAASFAGIWDGERRARVEQALLSTGRFNASEAFGLFAERVDAFQRDWLSMKQEACLATYVRDEQSEHVLALRNNCLAHKLEGAKALVTAFSEADARAAERAAAAAPESLEECADTAKLLGRADRLPADPEKRAAIDDIRSQFAVIRARLTAKRGAVDLARQMLEAARELGHSPTVAEAVIQLGYALLDAANRSDQLAEGERSLREGMTLAAEVGDNQLLAKTASHLFVVLAYQQRRIQEADAMLPMVEGLVTLAGNDTEQRLEVLMGRGMILSQRRKFPEAIAAFEQAIALSPRAESDYRGYGAYANGDIGKIDLDLRRYADAVPRFQAELDGIRQELGQRHPRVVFSLLNLGLSQSKAGLHEAARSTLAALRELVPSLHAPGDWQHVSITFLEGNILEDEGKCELAVPRYQEAVAITERRFGANNANTGDIRARLGHCLNAVGRLDEAIVQLERVLAIRTEAGGAPAVIAEASFNLARVLWSAGSARQRERARALVEQAVYFVAPGSSSGPASRGRGMAGQSPFVEVKRRYFRAGRSPRAE